MASLLSEWPGNSQFRLVPSSGKTREPQHSRLLNKLYITQNKALLSKLLGPSNPISLSGLSCCSPLVTTYMTLMMSPKHDWICPKCD